MQPDHKWRKYHSYSSIPHWLRAAPAEVSANISRYTYIAISAVSSSLFIGQERRVPARQDARMPRLGDQTTWRTLGSHCGIGYINE